MAVSKAPAEITVRSPEPDDMQELARICFEAFGGIQDHHGFTRDPVAALRRQVRVPATKKISLTFWTAVGANRVGISADPVEKQAKFADQQSFDYPLLSDTEGTVATQFGVRRGLLGKFMPVKRTTFVIDTDRTVLEVIASEFSMDTHADKALEVLRQRQSA